MQPLTERGPEPRLAAKPPRGARLSLKRRKPLVILLIVSVIAFLAWRAQGSAATVEVAPVTRGPLVVPLSTTGVVEAPIVDTSFDQAGRIAQLRAAEGDHVRAGQILATLVADTQRAGSAQADAAARAALEQVRAADASVVSQRKSLMAQEAAARAEAAVAAEQLRQLEVGPRPAEVSASVASLGRADAGLRDAEATVQRQEAALVRQRARTAGEIAQTEATVAAARARLNQAVAGYRTQEITQAEAEVTLAEADHRLAQQDLARIRDLVASGAVARQQLDTTQAREEAAKARVDAARARSGMMRAGTRSEEVEAARAELRAAEARAADARSGEADVRAQEEEVRGARARREDAAQAVQWSRDQLRLVREGARREEINAARARVRAAAARADAARAALEGIRSLVAQADAARATAQSARAAARSAGAILSQSELRAPFDGQIARKRVEPGQTVAPGTPVYTLVADQRAWVVAKVDDVDLDRVRVGQEIRVTADAFPGRVFRGRVRVIQAMAEPKEVGRVQAKIVRVRIRMDEGAAVLKPGMDVDIAGDRQVRASAVLVPNDAVVESEGHPVVWTLAGGQAKQRRIRTGAGNFDVTEVLDGLRPDERVIVHGKENLHEGDRVRVSEPAVSRK